MNENEKVDTIAKEMYEVSCKAQSLRMNNKNPEKVSVNNVTSGFNDLSEPSKDFYRVLAKYHIDEDCDFTG